MEWCEGGVKATGTDDDKIQWLSVLALVAIDLGRSTEKVGKVESRLLQLLVQLATTLNYTSDHG